MRWKKILILIVSILIAASAVGYYFFKKNENSKPSWRTAQVNRGTIKTEVTATGIINAVTTVQVGTQVSGTISKLLADFNSNVKKGQVIALIDTTFLAAAVEDAKANLQKAETDLRQAKRDFDRTELLYKEQVVPPAEYEQKLSVYESAQSIVRSVTAQLTRATINLQYATIKAPISGVVISRKVDVGQTVAASFNTPTLFTIANDLTKMQVEATVDEADIGQVRLGQNVLFTVDAYPTDSFAGKISQIRLEPVTLQNVVNYIVIIEVPNPDLKLMPGMTANISVKIDEHKNILKVPASALKLNLNGSNVSSPQNSEDILSNHSGKLWVTHGDSIIPVMVSTGLSDGTFAEVSGDIKEGDSIITGINFQGEDANRESQNPFMPRMRAPSVKKDNK